MLAARDDVLAFSDIFCRLERQVLGSLLGLNRLYLPNPSFKGMDKLIAEMRLTPPDLSSRLKRAFRPSISSNCLLGPNERFPTLRKTTRQRIGFGV